MEEGIEVRLLLVLLVATLLLLGSSSSALALDTASTASTVGGGEGKVDVLLGVETNDERGDVDDLLADAVTEAEDACSIRRAGVDVPDVSLPDQHTGVVDGLGKAALEDLSLEATLQEVLNLEGQDVIETHARLVEDTDANETANEGVTLEETLGVLGVELQELTSRTTNLGQGETNAPDLTLVAETIFTSKLQIRM